MKKLILGSMLVGAIAGANAQGLINFDNANAPLTSTATSTAGGKFWVDADGLGGAAPVLATSDFKATLLGGSAAGSLSALATTGMTVFDPGIAYDATGASYAVSGVPVGGTAYFQVLAWTGNYASYDLAAAAALTTPGVYVGQSSVFNATLGGGTGTPPSLDNMSAVIMSPVPEPTTFALAGLGAAAMLIFRRRK